MESHSHIEDQAAEWLARRDSGRWSDDDEARLEQWIGASTAHRVAYLRLKSTWDAAARLRALHGGLFRAVSDSGVPPPGTWRSSPFFEQPPARVDDARPGTEAGQIGSGTQNPPRARGLSRAPIFFAASALFASLIGTAWYLWPDGSLYRTPVGGLASVPMTDGSNITLNTDSAIRVSITDKERRVQLEHGEAFFEVAKDPERPFVVRAGTKRIIAVGTQFSVQHVHEDVRVLVTEGRVRVEDAQSPPVLLSAGSVARTGGSSVVVQKTAPAEVEEFLSWRAGYLRFHETSLADAIAEMNRYNNRKIVIVDPKLAATRISGTFRPQQYEAFVRVLEDGFSIRAQEEGDRIILTQRP